MKIPKSKYKGARLLDWDPERGLAQYWHWDVQEGHGIIERVQDVSGIIDRNERIKAERSELTESPDMRYIGSVPMDILFDWIAEGKISHGPLHQVKDEAWIKKKLNDPKYSKFKATDKRI